jgi:hypothetical protein
MSHRSFSFYDLHLSSFPSSMYTVEGEAKANCIENSPITQRPAPSPISDLEKDQQHNHTTVPRARCTKPSLPPCFSRSTVQSTEYLAIAITVFYYLTLCYTRRVWIPPPETNLQVSTLSPPSSRSKRNLVPDARPGPTTSV